MAQDTPYSKAVIAVDAGVNTGLVVALIDEHGTVTIDTFSQFVEPKFTDAAQRIIDIFNYWNAQDIPVVELVMERFDLRPGTKFLPDLTTVKINAAVEYAVDTDIVYQMPAQAKGLVKNEVLKTLGWYPTGKSVGYKDANDVRDAFRHLVYRLVVHDKNTWVTQAGWPT